MRSGLVALLAGESTVTNLVGSRIYIEKAPQKAALPYIIISQMTSDENGTLGSSGNFRFITFDIDCKADRSVEADALGKAVRVFIKDYTGAAGDETIAAVNLHSEQTSYEPPSDGSDTGVHVNNLDLTIQYHPS